MSQTVIKPKDLLSVPNRSRGDATYRVTGVYLGRFPTDAVVELTEITMAQGHQADRDPLVILFVPLGMVELGVAAGIFLHTSS